MGFVVDVFELFFHHLGVDLGGGDIRVAQHFLDGAEVRAVFQKVGGERVAQGVGSDVLVNLGGLLVVLDHLPEALAGHTLTVDVDEQGLLRGGGDHLAPDQVDVVGHRANGGGVHGDVALLAVGGALDDAGGELHVVDVHADELADTDAGGVKELQHSPVPVALHVGTLGLVQEQLHLLTGEDLRELFHAAFDGDIVDRVCLHRAMLLHKDVEALDGRKASGDRSGGTSLIPKPIHVSLYRGLVRLVKARAAVLGEVFGELVHVTHIGEESIGGHMPLLLEVTGKFVYIVFLRHMATFFRSGDKRKRRKPRRQRGPLPYGEEKQKEHRQEKSEEIRSGTVVRLRRGRDRKPDPPQAHRGAKRPGGHQEKNRNGQRRNHAEEQAPHQSAASGIEPRQRREGERQRETPGKAQNRDPHRAQHGKAQEKRQKRISGQHHKVPGKPQLALGTQRRQIPGHESLRAAAFHKAGGEKGPGQDSQRKQQGAQRVRRHMGPRENCGPGKKTSFVHAKPHPIRGYVPEGLEMPEKSANFRGPFYHNTSGINNQEKI